jgi:hypothetical protein
MKTMTVGSLYYNFGSIDINAVLGAELNGTESDTLFMDVDNLLLRIDKFQL